MTALDQEHHKTLFHVIDECIQCRLIDTYVDAKLVEVEEDVGGTLAPLEWDEEPE
jgi:hypothetical protein